MSFNAGVTEQRMSFVVNCTASLFNKASTLPNITANSILHQDINSFANTSINLTKIKTTINIDEETNLTEHNICAVNNEYNVSYLLIPKCGSTSFRQMIHMESITSEDQIQHCEHNKTKNFNLFKFTFIREPMARIISAYSTVVARENLLYIKERKSYKGPKPPKSPRKMNDSEWNNKWKMKWIDHFNKEIHWILNQLILHYDYNYSIYWNVHVVRMVDFLQGNELNYIGCIYANGSENMTKIDMEYIYNSTGLPSFHVNAITKQNRHERNRKMPGPVSDYANIQYLTQENKNLIYQFYKPDFELFQRLCLHKLIQT